MCWWKTDRALVSEAELLIDAARRDVCAPQIGHLERFNPAYQGVLPIIKEPLYFEVHRLGVFSPRSLDIDVVYDVMIHDLDILLALADSPVTSIHALGIPVITDKVDIAHARLQFASGAVGEFNRQPRLHRTCSQASLFPGTRICFPGLRPAGRPARARSPARSPAGI